MELSLDCTLDEAGHLTSVAVELPSLKSQCENGRCLGGRKQNSAFSSLLANCRLHFFIQESWIVLDIDGLLTSEKVQVNDILGIPEHSSHDLPRWRTLLSLILGVENGCVCTACLLFLIQEWSSGLRSHHRSQLSPKIRLLPYRIVAKVE
jgi:hypothetical protein